MSSINIYNFNDNVKVHYTGKNVDLPVDYRLSIENHWQNLLSEGRSFFRGESFTITDIQKGGGQLDIFVEKTDYAHFIYTMHKEGHSRYDCRVIYTSVLVETSDHEFVFGEMNRGTAFPRKLQLIGGGIDKDDIDGDMINLEHNIKKEIYEELGIDTDDKTLVKGFGPYLLKSGGKMNFLSAIYKLDLAIDQNQLLEEYGKFVNKLTSQGMDPEFKSLVFIKADCESVEELANRDPRQKDENLIPALKAALGIDGVHNICEFDVDKGK